MCATTTACKPMYEKQLSRLQLSVAISTSWRRRPSIFSSFDLFFLLKHSPCTHIATVLKPLYPTNNTHYLTSNTTRVVQQ